MGATLATVGLEDCTVAVAGEHPEATAASNTRTEVVSDLIRALIYILLGSGLGVWNAIRPDPAPESEAAMRLAVGTTRLSWMRARPSRLRARLPPGLLLEFEGRCCHQRGCSRQGLFIEVKSRMVVTEIQVLFLVA